MSRGQIRFAKEAARAVQVIGLAMFVAAFFFHAIILHDGTGAWGPSTELATGWECAKFGLIYTLGIPMQIASLLSQLGHGSPKLPALGIALGVSALENWLVPLYLLVPRRGAPAVAGAIVLSLTATGSLIVMGKIQPLLGCDLWMAGALFSLAPEIAALFQIEGDEPAG
jgi:hypothetical protein